MKEYETYERIKMNEKGMDQYLNQEYVKRKEEMDSNLKIRLSAFKIKKKSKV